MTADDDMPIDEEKCKKIRLESKQEIVPCQDENWDTKIKKETDKDTKTQNDNITRTGVFLRQVVQAELFIPSRFIKRKQLKYRRQNKKKKKDNRYKGSRHHILFYDKTYGFIFIFWGLIGTSNCKIEVTLLDKLIVFGGNVTLSCSCDDSDQQVHMWTKGNGKTQLTLGLSSNDKEKYKPSLSKDSYSLKITDFSIEDLDDYNCQFGFQITSYKLSLDNRFAYIPGNDDIFPNVIHGRGILNVTIRILKVYPDPECEISVQDYNMTNKVRTIRNQSSQLYAAVFTSSWILFDEINCTIAVELNCTLSTTQFYHQKIVSTCEGNDSRYSTTTDDAAYVTIVVFAVVGVVFIMVILFFVNYIWKRRNKIPLPCFHYMIVTGSDK